MALALRKESQNKLTVMEDQSPIGRVEWYGNPFHSGHQYLRIHFDTYDQRWAEPLFSLLRHTVGKPLQMMLSSDKTEQADFLIAGGFKRKRRCYEMEVSQKDFVPSPKETPVDVALKGMPTYDACCQLLFSYYKQTHEAVNPLTAAFSAFCDVLPSTALFQRVEGQMVHVAFVDENEIAYVASTDANGIRPFAQAMVQRLFAEHETLCFECDDGDTAAMTLKSLFHTEAQGAWDTYVLER